MITVKNDYPRVPFEVITQACDGDIEAINEIIDNYSPYIGKLSLRPMKDGYGNTVMIVDETLRGRMQIQLIKKILSFEIN